jgi:hypothetical protein
LAEEDHPLEALGLDREDEALGEGVGVRRHARGADDRDSGVLQRLAEARGELASRTLPVVRRCR